MKSDSTSEACADCGHAVPISSDRCPHCARPALFPNVKEARQSQEIAALAVRYDSARSAAGTVGPVLQKFEEAVAAQSEAVISRYSTEVFALAANDKALYANFYKQVGAGARLPSEGFWDRVREAVDSKLFNYYKNDITFAALSLNRHGLSHYGDCFLTFKDDMIAHRATVFEENSVVFMQRQHIEVTAELPAGYRALWQDRGRLAVAKSAAEISPATAETDFPALLMSDGTNPEDDKFIEVHIYGSFSIHAVVDVSLGNKGSGVRRRALESMLAKHGIALKKH